MYESNLYSEHQYFILYIYMHTYKILKSEPLGYIIISVNTWKSVCSLTLWLAFHTLNSPFGELDELMLWYVVNTAITPCIATMQMLIRRWKFCFLTSETVCRHVIWFSQWGIRKHGRNENYLYTGACLVLFLGTLLSSCEQTLLTP